MYSWRVDLRYYISQINCSVYIHGEISCNHCEIDYAIDQLSTLANELQPTLAMMAIRPIKLENDHYEDNYWGDGQEIEKLQVKFDGTPFKQEDNVDEKMEDVQEEGGKWTLKTWI